MLSLDIFMVLYSQVQKQIHASSISNLPLARNIGEFFLLQSLLLYLIPWPVLHRIPCADVTGGSCRITELGAKVIPSESRWPLDRERWQVSFLSPGNLQL
jgi:hypothetical protein